MRKYESVIRYGKQGTSEIFGSGEELIIEEKLDGANASMLQENGKIRCFSRNRELDEHNTLRGFYQYAQQFAGKLREGFIYYGEWLVPHKIKYPEEHLNKFYLFDVFDIKKDRYVGHLFTTHLGLEADLLFVPAFNITTYNSVDEVMKFVGKSKLAEKGEGIVIKYWNSSNRTVVKIVSDEFAETMGVKKQKVSKKSDVLQEFVEATVTPQRISKLLNKLVDEGVIGENYTLQDMPIILSSLGDSVYQDVMKEEFDVVEKMIKNKIGRYAPKVIKKVVSENGTV